MAEPVVRSVDGRSPQISEKAFVAPGAVVVGSVTLADRASVWFGAVLRADSERMEIGEESNVQDNATIHCDPGFPAVLGRRVTVGHNAVIHGAIVEDDVLVGMGSVLLNGCRVGTESIIGAGAVVPEGMVVPPGSLVLGVPAKVRGQLTDEQRAGIRFAARNYVERIPKYRS